VLTVCSVTTTMASRGCSLYLILLVTLCVVGTSYGAICENNSVNYTGKYEIDHHAILEVEYESGNVSATNDLVATFLILPGAVDHSYVMRKHSGEDDTEENSNSDAADATINALAKLSYDVDRICVAPPQPGAGLECVDLEDAGITKLMPMEVDADCNLIKGWATYLEPKTPGCNDTICTPVAYYATYTRSDSGAGAPIQLSSGAPCGFEIKTILVYIAVSTFAYLLNV
jgi:hypothetical protein